MQHLYPGVFSYSTSVKGRSPKSEKRNFNSEEKKKEREIWLAEANIKLVLV